MRVAAFTRYDRDAASTRQRLLQYVPHLRDAGIEVAWHPLLEDGHMRRLVEGRPASRTDSLRRYTARVAQIREASSNADLLWVYVELFPFLPAILEQALLPKALPVVYDWDDAFHVPYEQHPRAAVRALLGTKLDRLFRGASAVTCGNAYLRDYAKPFCLNSVVIPTVVDTEAYRPLERPQGLPLTIGWIGSPSTYPNLRPLLPLLHRLVQAHRLRLLIVGAGREAVADRFDGMDLVDWTEEGEIAAVQSMDIGIMPLLDLPFQRGKSGYKLIQYMACGLPVVASPVGVNSSIVRPGGNGFLAGSEAEWATSLATLLADVDLRRRLGRAGRADAVARYSLRSQVPRLVQLLRDIARPSSA